MHFLRSVRRSEDIHLPCQKIYLISLVVFLNLFVVTLGTDCAVPKPLEGKKTYVTLYDEGGKNITVFLVGICCAVNGDDTSVYLQKNSASFGGYKSAKVVTNTNYIQLTYEVEEKKGSEKCNGTGRSSEILFICDPKTDFGSMQVLQTFHNDFLCSYTFQVGTRHACGNKDGLSSGSIFCILFFTGVSLYLLLGFLYQRLVVGAKGLEQIPNYSFWRDFGNLQADGCDFVCRCGPRQESHSYRGIDERLPRDDERDDQLLNM